MKYFELDEPLLLPIADYPLLPPADRIVVYGVAERCFREKTEIVFSNRAYSPRSPTGQILMRWRNIPVLDRRNRAKELYCIGEVMKNRRRMASV